MILSVITTISAGFPFASKLLGVSMIGRIFSKKGDVLNFLRELFSCFLGVKSLLSFFYDFLFAFFLFDSRFLENSMLIFLIICLGVCFTIFEPLYSSFYFKVVISVSSLSIFCLYSFSLSALSLPTFLAKTLILNIICLWTSIA